MEEKKPEPRKLVLQGVESYEILFALKREETVKIVTKKKEVRRVRGKLSKKEIAKYSSTTNNVFDWIKKERVVVAEKETFESMEAEEI